MTEATTSLTRAAHPPGYAGGYIFSPIPLEGLPKFPSARTLGVFCGAEGCSIYCLTFA